MLTPTSISSLEPPIKTCELEDFNELIEHIRSCELQQFTGRLDLDVKEASNSLWSLFFCAGKLTGAASEMHPTRCWYRQVTQVFPQFVQTVYDRKSDQPQWSYFSIQNLLRQGKISQKQLGTVIEGCVTEILFDIFQQDQQRVERLPVQLSYRRIPQKFQDLLQVPISAQRVWLKASYTWKMWQQAEFDQYSPNLAPVIWSPEELRQRTSPTVYQNVTALVNGDRTLRDLAVRLKQPLVSLTRSIMPYVNQGIMGLIEVEDFDTSASPNPVAALSSAPSTPRELARPLVVYIDDSRFDRIAMGQILLKAGYRFINIQDPLQALPTLIEQKPALIFLDLLMPVTNGYEVCAQIRRVSALKNTPIIMVTSRDGIVDRVRAKLVNATGFIAKPIESDKVLTTLQEHLPTVQAKRYSSQLQALNVNRVDWQRLGSPVQQT
ncbi:MAG: response regulator [Leptolyngbyaceae cyanobacterium RM2_2_4]|nr:response regulator [Leptolyngbyaceae cyanobacterium SM1_4_3]NJO49649.1 response regulator [Leptolyngbyaceae cyanobacterium RM2_2_4]